MTNPTAPTEYEVGMTLWNLLDARLNEITETPTNQPNSMTLLHQFCTATDEAGITALRIADIALTAAIGYLMWQHPTPEAAHEAIRRTRTMAQFDHLTQGLEVEDADA